MNADLEMMILALKAAGIEGPVLLSEPSGHPYVATPGGVWNPLIDDGDALRLAVKLNFDVCRGLRGPDIGTAVLVMHGTLTVAEYLGDDPCAATRRAIVRAAAEIAKHGSAV